MLVFVIIILKVILRLSIVLKNVLSLGTPNCVCFK